MTLPFQPRERLRRIERIVHRRATNSEQGIAYTHVRIRLGREASRNNARHPHDTALTMAAPLEHEAAGARVVGNNTTAIVAEDGAGGLESSRLV